MKSYVETRTIDLGAIGEVDCDISYNCYPGTPESGRMGLPENYDPGSASEVCITSIWFKGLFNIQKLFSESAIEKLEEEIRIECDEEEL